MVIGIGDGNHALARGTGTTMITIRKMMTVSLAVAALATASIVASGDASARGGRGGGGFHAGGGLQGAGLRSGFQGMGSRHVSGLHSQARRPGRPGICRSNCHPGNPPGQGPGHGHGHGHGKRHFGVGFIGVGLSSCLQITPYGLVDVCE